MLCYKDDIANYSDFGLLLVESTEQLFPGEPKRYLEDKPVLLQSLPGHALGLSVGVSRLIHVAWVLAKGSNSSCHMKKTYYLP